MLNILKHHAVLQKFRTREINVLPPYKQLILQLGAFITALCLTLTYCNLTGQTFTWKKLAVTAGVISWIGAWTFRQPWWWQIIHAIFIPSAWLSLQIAIHPIWFLGGFALMFLVYRGAAAEQIPLYFTNRITAEVLAQFIPENEKYQVVDLGAGIGSVLHPLAKLRTAAKLTGLENAPLTWLAGSLRMLAMPNCRWRLKNLWTENLSKYDLIYVFLSPVPMPAIGYKAASELQDNALLISNSFPIPNAIPWKLIQVADRRHTFLYCYRCSDLKVWAKENSQPIS